MSGLLIRAGRDAVDGTGPTARSPQKGLNRLIGAAMALFEAHHEALVGIVDAGISEQTLIVATCGRRMASSRTQCWSIPICVIVAGSRRIHSPSLAMDCAMAGGVLSPVSLSAL